MDSMANLAGYGVGHWGNGTIIPDITREETRMYFYFLSIKYMEAGIEAIHYGQVSLMAMGDENNNYSSWFGLLSKVRNAAKTKARRGTILCDGHCRNISVNGKLLLDFASFPMRIFSVAGDPEKGALIKNYMDAIYGLTVGGIVPSGWSCNHSPYIVEFDNFGYSDHPGVASFGDCYVWGYDEIGWFYLQDTNYRNSFLEYSVRFVAKVDPYGFIQMPGSRVVRIPGLNTRYRCNTVNDSCPVGGSQETTIKRIWGT